MVKTRKKSLEMQRRERKEYMRQKRGYYLNQVEIPAMPTATKGDPKEEKLTIKDENGSDLIGNNVSSYLVKFIHCVIVKL